MNEGIDVWRLQKEIESKLMSAGAQIVGFADVSELRLPADSELRSAIAIGIPYEREIVNALDSEVDTFEKHLLDTKKRMEILLEISREYLEHNGFMTWIPPISENLAGLLSDFSHKTAATKAGLGWIGKSSLFVSPEFGCGVRLASVLTNVSFTPGKAVTESQCGDCIECVKACPYGAIRNTCWYPGIVREKLLDAFLCSKKREEYMPKLGYKHPCGLCIKACPVGKSETISR